MDNLNHLHNLEIQENEENLENEEDLENEENKLGLSCAKLRLSWAAEATTKQNIHFKSSIVQQSKLQK